MTQYVKGHTSSFSLFAAMEPRLLTRFDMRKFARDAYDAGIMYIGGCCYFEAYHIREMADEVG